MQKIFFFFLANLLMVNSYGMDFKVRAREHFESNDLSSDFASKSYKGFAPTINLWWEKPYDISYGFAISPGLGSFDQDPDTNNVIDEFRIYRIGGEVKYFPKIALDNIFIRGGLNLSLLDSKPLGNFVGIGSYAGLGYEFTLGRVGVAFEAALRYEQYEEGLSNFSFAPSIGFHFYELF